MIKNSRNLLGQSGSSGVSDPRSWRTTLQRTTLLHFDRAAEGTARLPLNFGRLSINGNISRASDATCVLTECYRGTPVTQFAWSRNATRDGVQQLAQERDISSSPELSTKVISQWQKRLRAFFDTRRCSGTWYLFMASPALISP